MAVVAALFVATGGADGAAAFGLLAASFGGTLTGRVVVAVEFLVALAGAGTAGAGAAALAPQVVMQALRLGKLLAVPWQPPYWNGSHLHAQVRSSRQRLLPGATCSAARPGRLTDVTYVCWCAMHSRSHTCQWLRQKRRPAQMPCSPLDLLPSDGSQREEQLLSKHEV